MKRFIFSLLVGAVLGLVGGYLFFGKSAVTGDYVPIDQLLSIPQNGLAALGRAVSGLDHIRNEIVLSGLLGASLGLNVTSIGRRR